MQYKKYVSVLLLSCAVLSLSAMESASAMKSAEQVILAIKKQQNELAEKYSPQSGLEWFQRCFEESGETVEGFLESSCNKGGEMCKSCREYYFKDQSNNDPNNNEK